MNDFSKKLSKPANAPEEIVEPGCFSDAGLPVAACCRNCVCYQLKKKNCSRTQMYRKPDAYPCRGWLEKPRAVSKKKSKGLVQEAER